MRKTNDKNLYHVVVYLISNNKHTIVTELGKGLKKFENE